MKRIDIYILEEIAIPTIISLFFVSCIMLLTRMLTLISLVIGGGVFLGTLLILSATLAILKLSLPIAFLIGCSVAFNRLSSDMEITALKSLGISIKRIVAPALIAASVLSIFMIVNNLYISPLGYKGVKAIALKILLNRKNYGVSPNLFTTLSKGLTLYTKKIEDGWMKEVLIFDNRQKGKERIIEAEKGKISKNPDGSLTITLKRGKVISISEDGREETLLFKRLTQRIGTGEKGLLGRPTKKELTIGPLIKRLKRERGKNRKTDILLHLHKRFSLAFTPLVFALMAIPISTWSFYRKERIGALGTSVAVFILYFALLAIFQNMVHKGLPPVLAAWLPNTILGLTGTWLLIKKARE